jgi:integrase
MQSHVTRSRRRNGEGSIGQRPDGRWQAKVSLPDGSRRSFYGKTSAEVEGKLLAFRQNQAHGLPIEPTGVTLASYLGRWLASRKGDLRPNTWTNYDINVRLHIVPHLGSRKPSRLEPTDVRLWHQTLKAEGLAPKSVVLAHATLRAGLAQAMIDGVVHRNVATLVHPPTVPKAKVQPYDLSEIAQLFAAMDGHPLESLFMVTLGTGLRRGEVCGLRWRDVDLEAGLLHVRGQLARKPGGGWQWLPPKTEDSDNVVSLSAPVLSALQAERDRQAFLRGRAGTLWQESGYVFTKPTGEPHSPELVYLAFRKLVADAGLRPQRFHDLRHAHASLALAEGASMWEVSKQLRHANLNITANIYAHLYPEGQRAVSDKVAALLERRVKESS